MHGSPGPKPYGSPGGGMGGGMGGMPQGGGGSYAGMDVGAYNSGIGVRNIGRGDGSGYIGELRPSIGPGSKRSDYMGGGGGGGGGAGALGGGAGGMGGGGMGGGGGATASSGGGGFGKRPQLGANRGAGPAGGNKNFRKAFKPGGGA